MSHVKNGRSISSLLAAAGMLAPALLVLPPVAVADTGPHVPFTQGERVPWVNVTNIKSLLYFNSTGEPDPGINPSAPGAPTPTSPEIRMDPFPPKPTAPGDVPATRLLPFAVTAAGTSPSARAVITSYPVTHDLNVSGSNAITVVWTGVVPDFREDTPLRWTVQVRAAGGEAANNPLDFDFERVCSIGGQSPNDFVCAAPIPLQAGKRRWTIKEDQVIVVEISAASTGGSPVATWSLRTNDYAQPSYLELRAENAVKVATWTMNREEKVTHVFRPDSEVKTLNYVTGFFAIKSAFGSADVCCVRASNGTIVNVRPTFNVSSQIAYRSNLTPYLITRNNLSSVFLERDDTNSTFDDGLVTMRFPARTWDINKWPYPRGEFRMETKVNFRPDDPRASFGFTEHWDFVISSQALLLAPYDDDDRNTQPSPLESLSHDMPAAGSTTFLLTVQNVANFGDNVTLHPSVTSATPALGWQVRIGGEKVVGGNRIALGPGEQALFTVTLTAPQGTVVGNSALVSLEARSGIDSLSKSKPTTLIGHVSDVVREDVGVVLSRSLERVRPGQDNLFTAYLWNRGTRAANLTMELNQTATPSWTAVLRDGSLEATKVAVAGIPPGALAPVTIKVRPELTATVGVDHTVRLNATLSRAPTEGPGMERRLTFRLLSISQFRVEVLKGINSDAHFLEMWCANSPEEGPPQPPPPEPPFAANLQECDPLGQPYKDDAVVGTWFRAWISNLGDIPDRFEVSLVNSAESAPSNATDRRAPAFYPPGDNFRVGVRTPKGEFRARSTIDLAAGQTGEVYVWVGHQIVSQNFRTSEFNFDLAVKSSNSRVELRQILKAVGEDRVKDRGTDYRRAVKLEHVERGREYFVGDVQQPVVNVDRAKEKTNRKFVDLSGAPQFFYARATMSHSDGAPNEPNAPKIDLGFVGVDSWRKAGWNITIRPRNGELDEKKNPWKEEARMSNFVPSRGRSENFYDQEFEVQVRAPLNGTSRISAGDKVAFSLAGPGPVYLDFVAEVSQLANVSVRADTRTEFVRPASQTAFTLYLANNGSIATPVSIRSRVTEETPSPERWSVTQQNLNLSNGENRTVALIVGAPGDASQDNRAVINVSVSFPRFPLDPKSPNVTRYLTLTAVVKTESKLRLTAIPSAVQAAPGGTASFQMQLANLDPRRVSYNVRVAPILNWTEAVPPSGTVEGESITRFGYVLTVPTDVLRDRSYQSVVKVSEVGNDANFDVAVVTIDIIGGEPFPLAQAVLTQKLIDRGATATFEVGVKNLGNAPGTFPLEAQALDGSWLAWPASDEAGTRVIPNVTVAPGERKTVYLAVRAPRVVPEGTAMPVTLTAFNRNFDRNSAATVKALVHDYALDLDVRPSRVDIVAGESAEFNLRVTNLGNGNDTINLTADKGALADWRVAFSGQSLELAPGATTEVRLTVTSPLGGTSPTSSLPTPRDYTFAVNGYSGDGLRAGVTRNDSAALVVKVVNYVAFDVDGDGDVELAVDRNKRSQDGFEIYREVHRTAKSVRSQLVDNLSGKEDGKITFLIEVPESDGGYDGIADTYFDPNDLLLYAIEFTPDVNRDATPDYLLDTDGDGVIDKAWDTATRSLWKVTTIHAFGGTLPQFLVDTTDDGTPDRYYDPVKNLVTNTIPLKDRNKVGIDTDNTGRTDKIFNLEDSSVTDAQVAGVATFARSYWYVFVLFGIVVVMFGIVLARRRRGP